MAGSYEKINYALRPAKNVERKMMAEAFANLRHLYPIEQYQYIGFGSTYFSDFNLFHRLLGLTNMISLEQAEAHQARFEFNRPFNCIQLLFGHSNDLLPTLAWDKPTILWLDYDDRLNDKMLTDIDFACKEMISGSIFLISVNAHPDRSNEPRLELLKDRVGEDNLPLEVTDRELAGWSMSGTCRTIIMNSIEQSLSSRNAVLPIADQLAYQQLFNFQYEDGSKMLTVGGVVYKPDHATQIKQCGFESLPFVRTDDAHYRIVMPNLTYREMRHLDTQLPLTDQLSLQAEGIAERDLGRYQQLYRYFPMFAETEI